MYSAKGKDICAIRWYRGLSQHIGASIIATAERKSKVMATNATPSKIGDVTGHTTKTFTFDVNITGLDEYQHDNAQEFILRVNGQVLKRMNYHQAERMGLVLR